MEKDYNEAVKAIFQALKAQKVTLAQIGAKYDKTASAVSKWKNLKNPIDGHILFELAEWAGISLSFSGSSIEDA